VAREAGLGRDMHAVKGAQRLMDEVLGVLRAVRVGRIDEVDPKLGQPLEHGDRCLVIVRRAPDALAGDAHGAEAEASDFEVAADHE
jgi:hypothetical protein